ncbi:MAG: M20/M25/M40 family metallo-hydrolase [Gemmatimonadota bacterium]|nr:M20/M25/M40 family metallo-hydrolase [Gemmatimonadota bacterium]
MPITLLVIAALVAPALRPDTVRVHLSSSDSSAVRAIVKEGMGAHSRVGADLQYLTDVIGPRLTGSPAMARANEWTRAKFREYGADSSWREPFEFGPSWRRGPTTLRMLLPHERWLAGFSWAWAPGTKGPLAGDVVYVDATTRAEFAAKFAGKLAGAWVMTSAPVPFPDPDGPPLSAADSVPLREARKFVFAPPKNEEETRYRERRDSLLIHEGIAGTIIDGAKDYALLTMSGSPEEMLAAPRIVVAHETFTQWHRLIAMGERVRIEASVENSFITTGPQTADNTIAEIRGTEHPAEVVLIGAHLDSWDLGTGATDNGAGAMTVLEAARVLKASGARPKRTIRFVLFSGEEEGLFGSSYYVRDHLRELPKYQAALVIDNGTGRIDGMSLQGRDELEAMWRDLFAPIADLGPFDVKHRNKGGTDHLPFMFTGVPGFNYDQLSRGYDHTHHSQIDSFDYAVVDDLKQAATVMAATAFELANLPQLLPRGPTRRPQ